MHALGTLRAAFSALGSSAAPEETRLLSICFQRLRLRVADRRAEIKQGCAGGMSSRRRWSFLFNETTETEACSSKVMAGEDIVDSL